MKYKVSVILPIFNVEKYLRECLDSILEQTIDNYELVAINDGSTDSSFEILEEYEEKFENIKIVNQNNCGLSATRNEGIRRSEGNYILFLDSDDMLRADALECLYNLAYSNCLDLVVYDGVRIDQFTDEIDNKKYDRTKIFKKTVLSKDEYFKGSIKKGMLHSPFHFYNKEFLNKNKLFFKDNLLHEDELFSMKSYQYINNVGYCNEKLYIRRYRKDSIMSGNLYQNSNSLNSYKYILAEFLKFKENNLNNDSYKKMVESRARLIGNNLIRYKEVTFKEIIRYSKLYNFEINILRLSANLIIFKLLK